MESCGLTGADVETCDVWAEEQRTDSVARAEVRASWELDESGAGWLEMVLGARWRGRRRGRWNGEGDTGSGVPVPALLTAHLLVRKGCVPSVGSTPDLPAHSLPVSPKSSPDPQDRPQTLPAYYGISGEAASFAGGCQGRLGLRLLGVRAQPQHGGGLGWGVVVFGPPPPS